MAGDPLWINASGGVPSYAANELRIAHALSMMYGGRLLGARAGVRPGGTQLKVTLAGTTITVDMGVCLLDPGLTTPQGPYWCALPAQETSTLTAADATNPRKDIVVARVYDNDEDASGLRLFRSEYIVGTPAPSPSQPATPAGALKLAHIDVPQSGGGAAVVTDDRMWTVATGGILPVNVAGDIAAGVAGRYRHRLDTSALERDTGAAWVPVGGIPDIQGGQSSGNYIKPAGGRWLHYRMTGGGGAGGGAPTNSAGSKSMGGGGGGAETAEGWVDCNTLASSVAYTIGAGGTGVSGTTGNNGTDTTFNGVTAKGGTGGPTRASQATSFGIGGGLGGTGGAGAASLRVPGGAGGHGWGTGVLGVSGAGGSTPLGAGGIGLRDISEPSQQAGSAGLGFGGGGGGGISAGTGSAVAGGSGAAGGIIFETHF